MLYLSILKIGKGFFEIAFNEKEESIPELKLFEQRLMALVRDVQFRKYTNEFQEKIKEDITTIRETQELIIEADKT